MIRKEKSLNPIIKYESLVVNGLDKTLSKNSVQQDLERVFKTSDSGVKDIKVIANNSSGEPLGHAYINYVTGDKGINQNLSK